MVNPESASNPHKNPPGRPRHREDATYVTARQRLLGSLRVWHAIGRCPVTGRRATLAALAFTADAANRGEAGHPAGRFDPAIRPSVSPPVQVARDVREHFERMAAIRTGRTRLHVLSLGVEIAARLDPRDRRAAEKWLEDLLREAGTYEYVHLGSHDITGRRPLPEPSRRTEVEPRNPVKRHPTLKRKAA